MSNAAHEASLARLDHAIARVEAAIGARERSHTQTVDRIESRRRMLRGRIAEAIARLDALMADGESGDDASADGQAN